MNIKVLIIVAFASAAVASCGSPQAVNTSVPKAGTAVSSAPDPSPMKTPVVPKDGDYNAKGVVTKINIELASVELDHADIPGVMPPMRMEFLVADKKILEGLKVGDSVDFVLRYKHPTETVVKISKAK